MNLSSRSLIKGQTLCYRYSAVYKTVLLRPVYVTLLYIDFYLIFLIMLVKFLTLLSDVQLRT